MSVPVPPTLSNLSNIPLTATDLSKTLTLEVVKAEIVEGTEVHQSNSESAVLCLNLADGTSTVVFAKKVCAAIFLSKKKWPDMRRTLCYIRNEARFYSQFAPSLKIPSPDLLGSITNFSAMTEAHMHEPPGDVPDLTHLGGTIFLSAVPSSSYYQNTPLSFQEVGETLKAIARLHAAGWEKRDLLERLQAATGIAGSYTLANRNPIEINRVGSSWSKYITEFSSHNPEFCSRPEIRSLGDRVQTIAEWIASNLSCTPSSPLATIQHGDFKAMNVFLPTSPESSDGAMLIDFASTGVGFPMSDIAMHLAHAITPSNLSSSTEGEQAMLELYYRHLESHGVKVIRSLLQRQYEMACIDYWRFMTGRFYGSQTPATYEKAKSNRNVALINRFPDAAFAFAEKVEKFVSAFESEINK